MSEGRARKAEASAIAAANLRKRFETEEAVRASRNVNGGRNALKEPKGKSLMDTIRKATNKTH